MRKSVARALQRSSRAGATGYMSFASMAAGGSVGVADVAAVPGGTAAANIGKGRGLTGRIDNATASIYYDQRSRNVDFEGTRIPALQVEQ